MLWLSWLWRMQASLRTLVAEQAMVLAKRRSTGPGVCVLLSWPAWHATTRHECARNAKSVLSKSVLSKSSTLILGARASHRRITASIDMKTAAAADGLTEEGRWRKANTFGLS